MFPGQWGTHPICLPLPSAVVSITYCYLPVSVSVQYDRERDKHPGKFALRCVALRYAAGASPRSPDSCKFAPFQNPRRRPKRAEKRPRVRAYISVEEKKENIEDEKAWPVFSRPL